MTTSLQTCTWCGATMTQRALYLSEDYGNGRSWFCRSQRQCVARNARRFAGAK